MRKTNKMVKNILTVALSNCTSIISGIIVGFCIPKILSVYDYGLYKTFTLYSTYLGLFSLGIIDGVVLDYGEFDYDELNKEKFRSFFSWYFLVHLISLFVLVLVGIFEPDKNNRFIIFMLGLDMLALNITGYFQQISQFTQRFKEFSSRKVILSVSNIITVLVMFGLSYCGNTIRYQIYVASVVFINIILAIWYITTYRDISLGKRIPLINTTKELLHLIKIGFPLLFANLCTTLILSLDRQFVSVLFDTSTYAIYAFAYNLLSLVTVATSAISVVLYPYLKRASKQEIVYQYPVLVSMMLIGIFAAIGVYFPLCAFVKWFLPQYTDSILIFRIIFPGLAISSSVTVIMHNYYKVFGENQRYFFISLIVLGISTFANWIAYKAFKTTISISVASIITMILWYMLIEHHLSKKVYVHKWRNFSYMIVMTFLFYSITSVDDLWKGALSYLLIFGATTVMYYRKSLSALLQIITKSTKNN